jgi:hypothetical protein
VLLLLLHLFAPQIAALLLAPLLKKQPQGPLPEPLLQQQLCQECGQLLLPAAVHVCRLHLAPGCQMQQE